MRCYYYSILLLLILISIQPTLAAVPNLGHSGTYALSLEQEQQLGEKFMQQVRQQLPLINDPIVNTYITHLGQRLASFSPQPDFSFHFFVVNSTEINAFAGPGGYIGINNGLILAAQSETELAAVMAHEIAHVTQRHIARSIDDQRSLQWASLLGLLAGISAGTQSPGAAAAIITATQSGTTQSMLSFSRDYEREADNTGREILTAAGYSTQGMTQFLYKLLAEHYPSPYDDLAETLSSHPSTQSRIANTWDVTSEMSVSESSHQADRLFYLIQARLAAESSHDPKQSAQYFQKLLKNTSTELAESKSAHPSYQSNTAALRYALVLSLLQSKQITQARAQIEILTKCFPNELLFQMTSAEITAAENKPAQTIKQLDALYSQHPDYLPLLLQYAQSLLNNNDSTQAVKLLQSQQKMQQDNLSFLALLAKAQYAAGDTIAAYQTQATLLVHAGEPQKAKAMLSHAEKLSDDPISRARIARQIKEIDQKLQTKK